MELDVGQGHPLSVLLVAGFGAVEVLIQNVFARRLDHGVEAGGGAIDAIVPSP